MRQNVLDLDAVLGGLSPQNQQKGGSPGERKRRPVPASGMQQHRLPSGYLADAQGGDKCLRGVQVVFDLRQSQLSTVGDQVPDRSHCSALKDWWFYPARYGVRPVTAGQPTPIRLRRYNPRRVTCWVSAKAARAVTVARAAVSIRNRGVGIFSSEGGRRPVGGDKCGKREGGARLEQGTNDFKVKEGPRHRIVGDCPRPATRPPRHLYLELSLMIQEIAAIGTASVRRP